MMTEAVRSSESSERTMVEKNIKIPDRRVSKAS